MRTAQLSAKKDGLGRPFFCGRSAWRAPVWAALLLGLATTNCLFAQERIYRCGHEYTNAPQGKSACVAIALSPTVTVIEGTRPNGAVQAVRTASDEGTALVPALRTKTDDGHLLASVQRERDVQARAILMQELDQAKRQQVQLQQAYKEQQAGQQTEKFVAMKAAIERNQRDIDSLQRELSRRPVAANP
ncbi:hypothetical protein [Limnohabitans sp. Jir72]|uniref:hypothetical protein n=1 Tax=Limnohabitans sp. Jir72 TaxID=1977909 RepID=UPI000D390700|nr:hypothetical protein [Limnohabitans sp. Jir72]PUE31537.1 hypothetical protein B9Z52_11680 [Limnohabitans sp. Jir72]